MNRKSQLLEKKKKSENPNYINLPFIVYFQEPRLIILHQTPLYLYY